MNYLKNYIFDHFNLDVQLVESEVNTIESYSENLSELINRYHNKAGVPDIEQLDTEEKICSFLLGVYYRYGFRLDENIYGMRRYEDDLMYMLLKKAGCNKILFNHTKYYIPNSTIFYFQPSLFLKKYFDTLEKEKAELNAFREERKEEDPLEFLKKEHALPKPDIEKMIRDVFKNLQE